MGETAEDQVRIWISGSRFGLGEPGGSSLRLDKWLKVSRLIKRRTVAQMACDQGRVFANERPAKSSYEVKIADKIHLELGSRALTIEVLAVPAGSVAAQDPSSL